MTTVKTITSNEKTITIMRIVKAGTKRVFFFPVTSENQRLTRTLYARQWEAEELAKSYLKSIN